MKLSLNIWLSFLTGSATAFSSVGRPSFCTSTNGAQLNMAGSGSMEFQSYGGGIESAPRRRRRRGMEDLMDPEKELNKYIQIPEPVQARPVGLNGSILVSGWAHSKERSDEPVFNLLNHEDSAFQFQNIIAFVNDEAFAKKRLLSRQARYTGLLGKLQFEQASVPGALPTKEQLSEVQNWLAHVEVNPEDPQTALETMKQIGRLSNAAGVRNVAILLSNSSYLQTKVGECVDALQVLDENWEHVGFTVVSVGELDDATPEGTRPYEISDFGTPDGVVSTGSTMSREESYRLVTECLALESGSNKALTFREVKGTPEELKNNTAAKLIKALRQAGYSRPQEIHHMITAGVSNYTNAIAEYKQKVFEIENPDPAKVMAAKAEQDKADKEAYEKSQAEYEAKKVAEIEEIARSWAKREYFRKSMGGGMGMTEEEYIESVWDRAMFEGDLKYRMMHGQKTDERKELSEFMDKQERKRQAAMKRAREVLGYDEGDRPKVGDKTDGFE